VTWKNDQTGRGARFKAGQEAGTVRGADTAGINLDGTPQLTHRIAWVLMKGRWPRKQLDHINMVRSGQ